MQPQREKDDSVQGLLSNLVQSQQEQQKEFAQFKTLMQQQQADLKTIKDKLLAEEQERGKRKKTDDIVEETTLSELRKDVQKLMQEYNIHNITLQKLEESCRKVVQKKTLDPSGLLKKLETEVSQLKTSHENLSNDLEQSNRSILMMQTLVQGLLGNFTNLHQQLCYHVSSLESVITILQSIESGMGQIRARLDGLPIVVLQEAPPVAVAQPTFMPNHDTVDPALLVKFN